eukprot:gene10842-22626_t
MVMILIPSVPYKIPLSNEKTEDFILAASLLCSSMGYVSSKFGATRMPRVKPVSENFFLDIGEDPAENTPRAIFGEAEYKKFVASYNPEGLIVGGPNYDLITRVRQLKLLTVTAESGLLQALEAKGLTLSQIEKLLPLVDDLKLLPFLVSNRQFLINVIAPLAIEPAPTLLPILTSILKTSPSTFLAAGGALVGAGVYESLDNLFIGANLILLGVPLLGLYGVLSGSVSVSIPSGIAASITSSASSSAPNASGGSRPVARKVAVAAPVVSKAASAPVVAKAAAPVAPKVAAKSNAPAPVQRVRKTVRVR